MSRRSVFALLLGVLVAGQAAAQPREAATVSGLVPVTATSGESYRGNNEQPVPGPGLPPPDLARYGYVQEEYFVSGTVGGKAYLTSLLVRKPADPAKFTGVVGVETIHAAGAIPFWGSGREVWAPRGHAWAGVASQRAALEGPVKKFNPARYASLHIPEAPGPNDPLGGGPQDLISQAIMTQVGVLLKSNPAKGPLAGMEVRTLLMGGASQTGGTTLRYIAESHSRARMPDGTPVYDGYLPMENFLLKPVSGGGVPIIHLVTEGDFTLFGERIAPSTGFTQRGDNDAANDRYREYQLTGAAHVPTRGATKGDRPGEQPSQFPNAPLFKGALLNLIEWVTKGTPPPKAAPIVMAGGAIVRDAYGNAKGGIRTPYVDLRTARYIAAAPIDGGDRTRLMRGLQEPLSPETLRKLYKTPDAYLRRFDAGIDRLVAGRWLLREDGEMLKADERKISF